METGSNIYAKVNEIWEQGNIFIYLIWDVGRFLTKRIMTSVDLEYITFRLLSYILSFLVFNKHLFPYIFTKFEEQKFEKKTWLEGE